MEPQATAGRAFAISYWRPRARAAVRGTSSYALDRWVEHRTQSFPAAADQFLERLRNASLTIGERQLLLRARADRDVCWTEDEADTEPLVTVRIATRNRPQQLVERAVRSALHQTYKRLDVLVVGDHCDDATGEALAKVADPRLRYFNLPRQGAYPGAPRGKWMVAGGLPWNTGNALAAGHWIAPLDDDDEFTSDHVEVLLAEAKSRRLEMIYSKTVVENSPGRWDGIIGSWPLMADHVSHGTVLHSAGLTFMPYSYSCYLQGQASDWNLWERMHRAGVRIGFLDRITYRYFLPGPTRGYSIDE